MANIIGYYPLWAHVQPEILNFSKVTAINVEGFFADADGHILPVDPANKAVLFGPLRDDSGECNNDGVCHFTEKGLIHLVHAAGKKVIPTITISIFSGGNILWAAVPAKREQFALECSDLITEYGFDGIDIAWPWLAFRESADTANFNLVLSEVRNVLDALGKNNDKHYLLMAKLPCTRDLTIDIAKVSMLLDNVNLMTYHFHDPHSDAVSSANAPMDELDNCVQHWLAKGAPADRLSIGLSFNGVAWKGVSGFKQVHRGADSRWEGSIGNPPYSEIQRRIGKGNMDSVRDESSMTQFAYFEAANGQDSGMVSFDDTRAICDKVNYAIEHDINGFVISDITGDVLEDHSTPLLDVIHLKLEYPNVECAIIDTVECPSDAACHASDVGENPSDGSSDQSSGDLDDDSNHFERGFEDGFDRGFVLGFERVLDQNND